MINRLKKQGMDISGTKLHYDSLVLSNLYYGIEFFWPLLTKADKGILERVTKCAFRRNITDLKTNVEAAALSRMVRLARRVNTVEEHILRPIQPPMVTEGRRAGTYRTQYAATVREQKTFFNFLSLKNLKVV